MPRSTTDYTDQFAWRALAGHLTRSGVSAVRAVCGDVSMFICVRPWPSSSVADLLFHLPHHVAVHDREDAGRAGKLVDGNVEDVLREERHVGEHAGRDRSLLALREFGGG